jgi:membrane-bound lytic murein transglycosylase MltF
MKGSVLFVLPVLLLLVFSVNEHAHSAAANPAPAVSPGENPADKKKRQLALTTKPWQGDFDKMLERRVIRFYVPYSRTLYFIDKGRERGISADLIREFERWVNKKYAKTLGKRPLTAFIVVATRDKLREDLLKGYADVAVGNIKVLPELTKDVDFVAPDDNATSVEVLVTGPGASAIASTDELSGKKIYVRKISSYYLSLTALNAQFRKAGKPEVKMALLPDALEDEDLLEMVNAGLLDMIVVDDWKAKMWAQVLPKVKIKDSIVLRPKTKIGWAIRKGSPKLSAELTEFYVQFAKQRGDVTVLLQQYSKRVKALQNASAEKDQKRFRDLVAIFEKYGKQYHFDPLMLAAQGYQESTLNQQTKSPVGAIGIMQVMPATGSSLKVGDIRKVEPNIHAGTKYMDQLMTKYFADANFDEQNRTLFAFASYNAGPGNIAKMRTETKKRGLDPDLWFNNVEIITAEKIGMETTTYVRNIFKYYAAYRLVQEAQSASAALKQQVAPPKK